MEKKDYEEGFLHHQLPPPYQIEIRTRLHKHDSEKAAQIFHSIAFVCGHVKSYSNLESEHIEVYKGTE